MLRGESSQFFHSFPIFFSPLSKFFESVRSAVTKIGITTTLMFHIFFFYLCFLLISVCDLLEQNPLDSILHFSLSLSLSLSHSLYLSICLCLSLLDTDTQYFLFINCRIGLLARIKLYIWIISHYFSLKDWKEIIIQSDLWKLLLRNYVGSHLIPWPHSLSLSLPPNLSIYISIYL